MQSRQHAGIGTPEVTEVIVRGVLAAEDRARLGHQCLDERVTDARPYRRPAVFDHELGDGTRGDQVMDDGAADFALQLPASHQSGYRRRRYRPTTLVDHKAPVCVAVKGQTDIGALRGDERLQIT